MKKQNRTNLEYLNIIVAAWNLSMADTNAICAKSTIEPNDDMLKLLSFISGKEVKLNELFLSDNQYANDSIEYYNTFVKLSKDVKYTKWKSLKRKPLIRTYGVIFDIYLSNGFNTEFLKHLPFFKMSPRQLAKIFIRIKHIV